MTLDTVPYTANAHPTRGRDGASPRDDGRLDVQGSSSGTPGSGTTPGVNHAGTATLVRPRRSMMMSAVSSSPTWRTLLATVAAAGAFGLVLLAAPSYAQTATAKETTVAPRDGPIGRRSMTGRRAYSSQKSRSWCVIGARTTTGGRRRRS
jgi:hypothetical protein